MQLTFGWLFTPTVSIQVYKRGQAIQGARWLPFINGKATQKLEEFCYESRKMVPFTAQDLPQQQHFVKEITVNTQIYCFCRMPQLGKDKMAQCTLCKEWFHQQCENIQKEVLCERTDCLLFVSIVFFFQAIATLNRKIRLGSRLLQVCIMMSKVYLY